MFEYGREEKNFNHSLLCHNYIWCTQFVCKFIFSLKLDGNESDSYHEKVSGRFHLVELTRFSLDGHFPPTWKPNDEAEAKIKSIIKMFNMKMQFPKQREALSRVCMSKFDILFIYQSRLNCTIAYLALRWPRLALSIYRVACGWKRILKAVWLAAHCTYRAHTFLSHSLLL